MKTYRVTVETTNAIHDTTKVVEGKIDGRVYVDCQDGQVIVVTDDPTLIFDVFVVKKLEEIGPGYCLKRIPIRSGIEMRCAARFCQVTFDDSSECIQLDIPDSWAILFCSLKHLYQWAREQSEEGFRTIGNLKERTTWIEPHEPRGKGRE